MGAGARDTEEVSPMRMEKAAPINVSSVMVMKHA